MNEFLQYFDNNKQLGKLITKFRDHDSEIMEESEEKLLKYHMGARCDRTKNNSYMTAMNELF
jgi:hypothetical protein